ncbi:MAG TPA: hypothetical protein VF756_09290 [Thermoanaerobaculia bacterium]
MLYRAGEGHARGFHPTAVFPDRSLALLAAAVLPGTGRDRGHLRLFDEPLLDALNIAVALVRSPQSLAYLLEAAGSLALERCGIILDSRVAEDSPESAA